MSFQFTSFFVCVIFCTHNLCLWNHSNFPNNATVFCSLQSMVVGLICNILKARLSMPIFILAKKTSFKSLSNELDYSISKISSLRSDFSLVLSDRHCTVQPKFFYRKAYPIMQPSTTSHSRK